ncbi:hypothetical protein ACHAQH_007246 [Verticillium albo-atrum]
MCQDHDHSKDSKAAITTSSPNAPPFPWDAGVYDAHCHPTDIIASLESIQHMRAAALTVMATRSQDQALLVDLAASPLAIRSAESLNSFQKNKSARNEGRVIPSFGWHPWFSHQLYDDSNPEAEQTYRPVRDSEPDLQAAKQKHYAAVLSPSPSPTDTAFLDSLPMPTPLSAYIAATRARLDEHPLALVGEIGLDKAFRLPQAFDDETRAARDPTMTPGGREGRMLSPQHVRMNHQTVVLKAQLALAGSLGRPVSVHGVQAHGVLYDTLAASWKGHEKEVLSRRQKRRIAEGAEDFSSSSSEDEDEYGGEVKKITKKKGNVGGKPFPPRICLHSFSGPAQVMKQYLHAAIPASIFFSFSWAVNLGTGDMDKLEEVVKLCPDDRILVESDLHTAGDEMDEMLEAMYRKVCEIKGWKLEEGVTRIGKNYEEFIFG